MPQVRALVKDIVQSFWFDSSPRGVPLTTSANSLKTLQYGLKQRETTKDTKGKQGKPVLFTEHYLI